MHCLLIFFSWGLLAPKPLGVFRYRLLSYTSTWDCSSMLNLRAHVNGNIISSSAIAFRLLFTLSEQMNKRQRQNVLSTLDFIKYDHKVSLSYSLVMKVRRENRVLWEISRQVKKTKDFSNLKEKERNEKIAQFYQFYNSKTSSGNPYHNYDLDLDKDNDSNNSLEELQCIYRLKQYGLVNSVNVMFYKQGYHVTSEEMSSGEFAMLSTILSISTAVSNPHSLVLIDEPEQSLHPNWQMSIIDNLDRAITKQSCHFLIATHSHMLVSDLPINRSSVVQLEKDELGSLKGTPISDCTYGWSAEEVLLKVFKTATDRNRYFGERIGKLLEKMGNNSINPKEVARELKELQEISRHLSDIDPMKMILNTIVETYNK
ncbi:ATP-binding protein [Prevotella jejuni]|nr:ATP-binding protein [Prevotella jejuni]